MLIKISEELIDLYNNLRKSNNQMIISEITFIKITLLFSGNDNTKTKEDINDEEPLKTEEEKEEVNITSKNNDEEKNQIEVENKDVLINNALCLANKDTKNSFVEKYTLINDYLTSKTYNSIANLLIKATPEVVSDEYIIFTFAKSFEVVLFDKNLELITKFLKTIYKKTYNVVAITEEEWLNVKEDYIKNIKSGKKYELIDLNKAKKKSKKKSTELENSIENIFGEEYIVED